MFKNYVQNKMQKYVKKYFEKHPEVKLIVVTGSVGKTSTKHAIGLMLSQRYRVRMHEGNHNTLLSANLGILGIDYPGKLKSIGSWMAVFKAARKRIKNPTDVDVIIQELGSDHPGEIAQFGAYLVPDLALVTAVTPEHMEYFKTIDAVAQEELTAANFSKAALINRDDIDGRFAQYLTNTALDTYGSTAAAEYRFEIQDFNPAEGYTGSLVAPEFGGQLVPARIRVYGEHSLRPIMGGVAVAIKMGMTAPEIVNALAIFQPVPGRMNLLKGIQGTTIIDDTYNSSPAAAVAALQTLFSFDEAPQRIAVMGDMNELGADSQAEHERIGAMCKPDILDWLVTIGPDSEKYMAPAARRQGCQVRSFQTALEAGAFTRSVTQDEAVILVKGSQGGIFAEETVKMLCDMSEDVKLVRQSEEWMETKNQFFSKFK